MCCKGGQSRGPEQSKQESRMKNNSPILSLTYLLTHSLTYIHTHTHRRVWGYSINYAILTFKSRNLRDVLAALLSLGWFMWRLSAPERIRSIISSRVSRSSNNISTPTDTDNPIQQLKGYLPLTHSHTHTLTHTLTHSHTHTLTPLTELTITQHYTTTPFGTAE